MEIILSGNDLEFMKQIKKELIEKASNISEDNCQVAAPDAFRAISKKIKENGKNESIIVFMASRIPGREIETDEPALCDGFLEHIAELPPDADLKNDPYLADNIQALQFIDTTDKKTIMEYILHKTILFYHAKDIIEELISKKVLTAIGEIDEEGYIPVTYGDGSENKITLEEFTMDTLTHEDAMANLLSNYLIHCYHPKGKEDGGL